MSRQSYDYFAISYDYLIAILKKIEVLSPELQSQIGFAKPEVPNDDDINGDFLDTNIRQVR